VHGVTAVVRGQAGIGKSWLIDRVIEVEQPTIEATRTLVLRASGHRYESDLPFAGLHQLLLPVSENLDLLADPQRQAIERALARRPAAAEHRYAAAVALHSLLAMLGEQHPVLVVIEDVHVLDAATTASVLFAARRLTTDRVAMVLTTQDPVEPTGIAADDIGLTLLGDADARQMMNEQYPDLTPTVRDEMVRVAGGLPLVLSEAPAELTVAQRRGLEALPAVVPIGPTLSQRLRNRLASIGTDARLGVLIVSLDRLGHATSTTALDAAGVDAHAIDAAVTAGLLTTSSTGVELAHPAVAAAVQAGADATMFTRARRALAVSFADEPHHEVWFLDVPTQVVDDALATKWDAAAADAEARRAWSEAASAYEHGARHARGSAHRRRLVRAALCHGRIGTPAAVLRLLDELIGTTDHPDERLRLESQRITTQSWSRSQHIDADTVGHLVSSSSGASTTAVATMLASLAVTALLWGDNAGALAAVDEAKRHTGSNDPGIADRLICDIVEIVGGRIGAGDVLHSDWLDEVSDEQLLDPTVPVFLAAFVLVLTDDAERARAVAGRLHDVAERAADLGHLGLATGLLGFVDQRRGDMAAARTRYSTATELLLGTEFMAVRPHLELRHAHLLAALGDEVKCRSIVATFEHDAGASPVLAHLVTSTLGLLELTIGECHLAVTLLERAEEMVVAMQLGEPGYITQTGDLVEALWRLRRTDRAGEFLHRYAVDAEAIGRPSALAIVSRSRGLIDVDESIDEHFALAHHYHRLAPDRYQQARTDLCWGMRLRRARRKSDARGPLRSALGAFDAMGASPWAACAASELAACGERRRTAWAAVDELTPRELEVAVAVADGATNPAVAAALGISVRTIEDHLTRIYRKLDIEGRRALPAALARPGYSPAAVST
jgi:DNA-binding CsgD family transcriptional regulator